MHTYVQMTKVISISDEVYNGLSLRKNGRSFTKVIAELLEQVPDLSIMKLAGSFQTNAEEWKEIKKTIYEMRHKVEEPRVSF